MEMYFLAIEDSNEIFPFPVIYWTKEYAIQQKEKILQDEPGLSIRVCSFEMDITVH